jgi:hypothetical protein
VAVDDMRQGGDPRLPLELALVKVTRPAADLERESLSYRLEQLEHRLGGAAPTPPAAQEDEPVDAAAAHNPPPADRAPLELEQLQDAWQRAILPAVEQRSIPTASMLREAHPTQLAGDTLTLEFPAAASFHRQLAEERKNATLLAEALYEVTGRRLALEFAVGENGGETGDEADEQPAGEEQIFELMKEAFDAHEVDDKQ